MPMKPIHYMPNGLYEGQAACGAANAPNRTTGWTGVTCQNCLRSRPAEKQNRIKNSFDKRMNSHQWMNKLISISTFACLITGAMLWQLNWQGPAILFFILGLGGMMQYLPVIVVKPTEYNDES